MTKVVLSVLLLMLSLSTFAGRDSKKKDLFAGAGMGLDYMNGDGTANLGPSGQLKVYGIYMSLEDNGDAPWILALDAKGSFNLVAVDINSGNLSSAIELSTETFA